MKEKIQEHKWKLLVAFVTIALTVLTAWGGVAIRYESMRGKINVLEKQQKEIKDETNKKLEKLDDKQNKMMHTLGRIEGKLEKINGGN